MQKYVSDCLGVTPGIRISSAKSDASIGVTGRVVPRHSLENDLVVSLNLLKTDRGLRKPRQPLGSTRRRRTSSSRLRTPAMATPPGRPAGSRRRGQRGGRAGAATPWPGAGRPGAATPPPPPPGAGPAGVLVPSLSPKSPGGKAVLLSGPRAEAFLLLGELLFCFFLFLSFFFDPDAGARRAGPRPPGSDRDWAGDRTDPRQSSLGTSEDW